MSNCLHGPAFIKSIANKERRRIRKAQLQRLEFLRQLAIGREHGLVLEVLNELDAATRAPKRSKRK